jgi:hypothetical protein
MNKDQKNEVIELLKGKFSQYSNFYITNTESLSVEQVNKLRKVCFDKNVEMKVAKNTLIRKALESLDAEKYSGVFDALNGVTALMFSDSPKEPAVIISSFRKDSTGAYQNQERAYRRSYRPVAVSCQPRNFRFAGKSKERRSWRTGRIIWLPSHYINTLCKQHFKTNYLKNIIQWQT